MRREGVVNISMHKYSRDLVPDMFIKIGGGCVPLWKAKFYGKEKIGTNKTIKHPRCCGYVGCSCNHIGRPYWKALDKVKGAHKRRNKNRKGEFSTSDDSYID